MRAGSHAHCTASIDDPRLLLRTLQMHQAQVLFTLANGPKIADNTANIPSPYTLETAQDFIAGIADKYRTGELLNLGCMCAAPTIGRHGQPAYQRSASLWALGWLGGSALP